MIIESAVDRIFRILALSIGIGSAVFTLLGLPGLVEQQRYLSPGYSITAYVVYCGLPIVLAILSAKAPIRVLRAIAAIHAVSGIVLLLFWVPALDSGGIPGDPEPWLMNIAIVALCTSALVLPYIAAWAFLVVLAVIAGVVRFLGYSGVADGSRSFQDAVLISLLGGVFMSLVQLALRSGLEQDAASVRAQDAAAQATAAEALERQRTRYHAFTHDDVLATLNSAARNAPGTGEVVRSSARHALDKMDEFRVDSPAHPVFSAIELEHLLRAAAAGVGIDIDPVRMARGAHSLFVPADVGDALAEALAEALRNSLKHADWPDGRPVVRQVRSVFSGTGVEIVVTDNGRGFASRRVALDRLGVRLSILQRVNSQPGGIATVHSARGRGTTVTLTWTADDWSTEGAAA
jgi:signal transduction histidine kinase